MLELFLGNIYFIIIGGFIIQGIGVPMPLSILLGALGILTADGLISLPTAVLLMFISSYIGNMLGYLLGYYYGHIMLMRFSNPKMKKFIEIIAKRGPIALLLLRLPSWGYAQLIWLLGASRSPLYLFMLSLALANLLWSIIFVYFSLEIIELINNLF